MIDNQRTRHLCDIKAMKFFEQFMNNRRRQNSVEQRICRLSLEISELRRELAKMSAEIAQMKYGYNRQEEPHGRE